jgi:hypothetical protein
MPEQEERCDDLKTEEPTAKHNEKNAWRIRKKIRGVLVTELDKKKREEKAVENAPDNQPQPCFKKASLV